MRITLIDKRNFNLFQPLLYQVSTGLVSRGDIATPLRELVGKQRNVQVLLGEVTTIHPEGKQIVFNGKAYGYDHLILATGSGSSFFGHDDWRTFAPPMKILEHAEEIRRRLLMAMEQAEQTPDPDARQFLQTVVIVGAGPSGCEMAGAVSELMRWATTPSNSWTRTGPGSCWWTPVNVSCGRCPFSNPRRPWHRFNATASNSSPGAAFKPCAQGKC